MKSDKNDRGNMLEKLVVEANNLLQTRAITEPLQSVNRLEWVKN